MPLNGSIAAALPKGMGVERRAHGLCCSSVAQLLARPVLTESFTGHEAIPTGSCVLASLAGVDFTTAHRTQVWRAEGGDAAPTMAGLDHGTSIVVEV